MSKHQLDPTTTLTTNSNNETTIRHQGIDYKITVTKHDRIGDLDLYRYTTKQGEEFLHIPSQEKLVPHTTMPWYAYPSNVEVYLDKTYKHELLEAAVQDAGGKVALRRVLKQRGASMNAMFVYKHLHDLRDGMPLDKLIPILDHLGRDLDEASNHITAIGHCRAVEHPDLPFDLGKKHGARLVAARYGDGTLSSSHNYGPTFDYANNDPEMRNRIVESLTEVFGRVTILNREYSNGEVAKARTSTRIIGYALRRAGALVGALFEQNPHVPTWIQNGSMEIRREWLLQVFGDEGFVWRHRGKLCMARATDIVRFLSEEMKNRLKRMKWRERFEFGKYLHYSIAYADLPSEIRAIIEKHPPNLLVEEKIMLGSFGVTTIMYPQEIYHGKEEGRYGVNWILQTLARKDTRRYSETIGFPQERKHAALVSLLRHE